MNIVEVKEALLIGLILSFLIGPVFFILIETSILKGFRAAIAFDLGVMLGDIIFLLLAYFGSKPLLSNLENNPLFLKIGGLILLTYGLTSFFKTKQKTPIQDESIVIKEESNYIRLFIKGFLINLINIGTLGFWIGLMLFYGAKFNMSSHLLLSFFSLILLTYLGIDILKILLAKKLRIYLTPAKVYKMKKILALVLVGFGLILFFKDYLPEKQLEKMEKKIEKPLGTFQNHNEPSLRTGDFYKKSYFE